MLALYRLLGGIQSQADAHTFGSRAGGIRVEYGAALARRYADTLVSDFHDGRIVAPLDPDEHFSPAAVFDRIGQKG